MCVFAKPPVAGKVKTRLATTIGKEAAAALASAMLRDVWSTVLGFGGALPVLAATEEGDFPIEVAPEQIWLQKGDGLGARIRGILRRALAQSNSGIALGADSPLITKEHLREAVSALQTHDAVLGPSFDGGFYLLGVRNCPETLLDDVPWSSSSTCERTRERLTAHGMKVAQLERLGDVDTAEDLHLLREALDVVSKAIAPATRQWLNDHG